MPFPAVLADELAALMVGKGRDDLVFTDMRGGVLRNSNWRARVFEPAVKKCQMADESFPSITRTTCGTARRAWRCRRARMSKRCNGCSGTPKLPMTLEVYADLFDDDVAANLNPAIRAAVPLRSLSR
ncbi:hypothetical protein [Mycobacterium sp.]|uniref:hypothetical protein n=1 Tax=Mycobacterium sp. TaxID=1785 RepID=UPI003BEF36CD